MKARIYHNPRCSKSRAAVELLQQRGVDCEIYEYLKTPPSRAVLATLARKLGGDVAAMVRQNEPEYRAAVPGGTATNDELLDLLAREPKLLQRPILETATEARIGRPPEAVLELCR